MKKSKKENSLFINALELILKRSRALSIKEILIILEKHGHATLLLIFSLPLCLPIPLPGLSTPLGIILCLIGIQMGFTHHLWLPKWVLKKKISKNILEKIVTKLISLALFLQKFLHPRLPMLTKNKFFIGVNGILIAILAIFLSLPLPIPLSNFVSTLPIICMALGFLEDDGVCVLVGYFLALVCFTFFFCLVYFGLADIKHFIPKHFF